MHQHPYPLRRLIALFLLAWIAVDLAGIDTCALDIDAGAPGSSAAAAVLGPPGTAHPPTPLHVDHCICHSHSIEPTTPACLAAPVRSAATMADLISARPHGDASALYHPPPASL
ncbi:MAG: hypothetical protein NTY02_04155 [Acidobacteria bacterium]|nr:hypothetical protein [Acidobacteriota bacterium]